MGFVLRAALHGRKIRPQQHLQEEEALTAGDQEAGLLLETELCLHRGLWEAVRTTHLLPFGD